MKRIILSISAIVFLYLFSFGQQKDPFLVFDSESHDFGKIKEEAGPATHKFMFTNTGSLPLIIKDVKPSCGCTTPDWTKEPVLPGNKGFISATYNPSGRPGPFTKTITVTSNATNNPVSLKFNGSVIPKPKSPEDEYPTIFDSVRLKSNFMLFDTLYSGESKTKKIELWNTLKSNATITFANVPKYIKLKVVPATLKPNEKGIVEVTYNSKDKKDWGYVSDNINFVVNNKVNVNNRIIVSADIKEDFAKLSPKQIEKAPKIVVAEHSFDYGTVTLGQEVKHDFMIKNEGQSDLIIHKKSASCGCTSAELKSMVLKPGQSEPVSVTLRTDKVGEITVTITLITNDPKDSKIILFIRGTVTK